MTAAYLLVSFSMKKVQHFCFASRAATNLTQSTHVLTVVTRTLPSFISMLQLATAPATLACCVDLSALIRHCQVYGTLSGDLASTVHSWRRPNQLPCAGASPHGCGILASIRCSCCRSVP